MPILSHFIIDLDKKAILKNLGLKFSAKINGHSIERLLDEELAHSRSLIESKAVYKIFPIEMEEGYAIHIQGGFTIFSRKLSKWLGKSKRLAIMAATIGNKIEEKASGITRQGETTRGLILDAIGSHAVERVADLVEGRINREANFRTKKRFSCGYSDWDLTDQKKIVDLIEAEKIGIKVTEKSILIPEKSITAVIGIY